MQISSIVDITQGELLNSPCVSFIYNIKTKVNKIHEGDLFIAKNQEDIQEAIKKGAFCIIYDFNINISDNEIAWIKVKSVNVALSKLFRFKLSTYDFDAYYCNDITYELLDIFLKNSDCNVKLLSNNLEDEIQLFENIENYKTIICSNKDILDKIYPNNTNFNNEDFTIANRIEHSLFETSFSYGNNYFARLKLSSLYINDFLKVFTFFKNNIDTSKLKKMHSFKPLFIDRYFKIIDYGYSDKFVLSNTDIKRSEIEINHLKNKYSYAKTFIFAHSKFDINNTRIDKSINNLNEIKDFLNQKKFNAIYIIGFNQAEIIDFITKNSEKSLL